jgi:hypothetical protein
MIRQVSVEQLTDNKGECPIQTYAKGRGPTTTGMATFNRTKKSFVLNGKTYRKATGGFRHWTNATHYCVEDGEYYRMYRSPQEGER